MPRTYSAFGVSAGSTPVVHDRRLRIRAVSVILESKCGIRYAGVWHIANMGNRKTDLNRKLLPN